MLLTGHHQKDVDIFCGYVYEMAGGSVVGSKVMFTRICYYKCVLGQEIKVHFTKSTDLNHSTYLLCYDIIIKQIIT